MIAIFATISLMVAAGAVALVLAGLEVVSPSEFWGVAGAFRTGFYATLLFGIVPAVLLGGPAYWLLWRAGRASRSTVLVLGAALGAVVAGVEPGLTAWGVGCGILVSGLTHGAVRRWLRPRYPSKPASLRGPA